MHYAYACVATAKLTALLSLIAILACDGDSPASAQPARERELAVQTKVFTTEPYIIDQIYKSMKGPKRVAAVQLGDEQPAERLWILSYATEIVDAATSEPTSEEFMCHNNLDFEDSSLHLEKLGSQPQSRRTKRLFTLSQGAMRVEFPSGFGLPIMSDEKFHLTTQILNLNPIAETRGIRYRTTVHYVRDQDAHGRIRPLYQKGVQGLKRLDDSDGFFGVEPGDEQGHGESCSVGRLAGERTITDDYGRKFAGHWVVEPGREENHTLATEMIGLKRDATVHYIATHLHPFAESLELRDITTGEAVFKSKATNSKGRIGLEHVESFASEEGVRLYKDHEYSLISIYDNPTDEPQDAMAVMFIYMLDQSFENPTLEN